MAALKKTMVRADNLGFFENKGNYRCVDGVLSVNTYEKCAGVYKGIPIVYFGGYIYQQYISGVTQLFMYQQYVYGGVSCCPLVVHNL